jgi:hypothetical protein
VEPRTVTIDEIVATFSSHVSKSYPSPKDFRRNFGLLLKGKRERADKEGYSVSLEKNIVFLVDLVAEGERLVERLLRPGNPDEQDAGPVSARLEAMEKTAHERTAKLHREAFVEGTAAGFEELRGDRSSGGAAYVDKLEFNYRYLMTLRIFLFEFISVLAAVRSEYSISGAGHEAARKIRDHLELTAHYYLGNVAVGEEGAVKPDGELPI